ncbi:MAG: hypothetical protein ABID38_04320 [Candidatus Diapherotrites archaeon]
MKRLGKTYPAGGKGTIPTSRGIRHPGPPLPFGHEANQKIRMPRDATPKNKK